MSDWVGGMKERYAKDGNGKEQDAERKTRKIRAREMEKIYIFKYKEGE